MPYGSTEFGDLGEVVLYFLEIARPSKTSIGPILQGGPRGGLRGYCKAAEYITLFDFPHSFLKLSNGAITIISMQVWHPHRFELL